MNDRRSLQLALLMLGNFACSTSVLFIKASAIHPVLLSSYRLWVAVLALSPLFVRAWLVHRHQFSPRELYKTLAPGVLLGLHFISWIIGARMTAAVNSTAIVNLIPLATPVLLFLLANERLRASEWRGSLLALGGVVLLTSRDYSLGAQYFLGDVTCFVSMLLAASYLVLARRNRHFPSIWLYLVPVYAVAALLSGATSFAFESPFSRPHPQFELWMVLGLGLVPTVIGHSALNNAMRHVRGQVVGLSNLSQPLFAGVTAFVLFSEVPDPIIYPAGALIIAGATLAFRGNLRRSAPEAAAA